MLRERLGGLDFWRPTMRLALPIALQNLLMSSFSLVDTLMIGQLGSISLSAVGMAGQWSWLMFIFFFGFSSGASVFISQYWGSRDHAGISHTYGLLLLSTLGAWLVFFLIAALRPTFVLRLFTRDQAVIQEGVRYLRIACFSYLASAIGQVAVTMLRSTERVHLPLYASMVGITANAILNYILIFGKLGFPALGVEGAAIATVISAWLNPLILYLVSLRQRNLLICAPRVLFRFHRASVQSFFRVSAPVLFNESLWAMGTVGYNMVFGHMHTDYYAAMTIFRTVEGLCFVFFVGLCNACSVLVGKEIGADNTPGAILFAKRFMFIIPALSVVIGLIMILLRSSILSLFHVEQTVHDAAMHIMLIYGLELPLRNIPYIAIVGIFRAGGDTRTGMHMDILCVWCLALPLTILSGLVLRLPFPVVYLIMLLSEDVIKATLCVFRFRSMRWIQPIIGLDRA